MRRQGKEKRMIKRRGPEDVECSQGQSQGGTMRLVGVGFGTVRFWGRAAVAGGGEFLEGVAEELRHAIDMHRPVVSVSGNFREMGFEIIGFGIDDQTSTFKEMRQ